MDNSVGTSPVPKNMRTFLVIWAGQLISILGSGLTGFGLGVWIFTRTGQATPFALTALFANLPRVILSPFAGSIADRYNRRRILILADTGAALVTLGAVLVLFFGDLQVWHIYVIAFMGSVFGAFQTPAYQASITMLVPKKDLTRAAGLQQSGEAIQVILTPILAAALYGLVGLTGLMVIDFISFFFAVGALLLVHIPQPKPTTQTEAAGTRPSLLRDAVFGWNYVRQRPGLFWLLWYFAAVNFFLNISGVLWGPLVLSFGSPQDLGLVQMSGGLALLLGGVLISAWGGPKNRKVWLLIAVIALSGFGYLIAGSRPATTVVAAGLGVLLFFIPMASALSQAVWQLKVAPDIQGRVFSIRSMIAWSILPLSNLLAGPFADRVFVPMLEPDGFLADTFVGALIGTGPGRGIGLMMIFSAVALWVLSALIFTNPRVRNVEAELPDAIVEPAEVAEEKVSAGEALPAPAGVPSVD